MRLIHSCMGLSSRAVIVTEKALEAVCFCLLLESLVQAKGRVSSLVS
jgi:hypothetical protein